MIYLDANFFIFGTLDKTKKGENARNIFEEIINGRKAVTSVLVLDEVIWVLIRNKKKELVKDVIEEIYLTPNLTVCGVMENIPLNALTYLESLKPRDAFHLAVMKELGINQIVTDDSDFDKIKWVKRIKFS